MPDLQSSRDFRDCLGAFATGVCVVIAETSGRPQGMTLNSFASVSLEPPLVLVSLATGTRTLAAVREAGRFAISVLHRRQQDVANAFAKRGAAFPAELALRDPDGYVVVPHSLAILRCRVERVVEAGDHEVVFGEVMHFAGSGGQPLLFHRGVFGGLDADGLVPTGRSIGFETF